MGLSIDELLENSPALMQNNAKGVRVSDVKRLKSKGGFPIVAANTYTPASRRKRHHKTWFVGKERDVPLSEQDEVLAQCACENYMYMFEVANHHHEAAQIIYSNGEFPHVTNPGLSPGLCLAGNTLVITPDGSKRLETIIPGDFVLGTGGFTRVIATSLTDKSGKVVDITFTNKTSLTLTLNHSLLTTSYSTCKDIERMILQSYALDFQIEEYGFGYRPYYQSYLEYKNVEHIRPTDFLFFYLGSDIRGDLQFKPKLDDYQMVKIESVSNPYYTAIFDIEVVCGHFMANGIISSNCKHLLRLAKVIDQRGY